MQEDIAASLRICVNGLAVNPRCLTARIKR